MIRLGSWGQCRRLVRREERKDQSNTEDGCKGRAEGTAWYEKGKANTGSKKRVSVAKIEDEPGDNQRSVPR